MIQYEIKNKIKINDIILCHYQPTYLKAQSALALTAGISVCALNNFFLVAVSLIRVSMRSEYISYVWEWVEMRELVFACEREGGRVWGVKAREWEYEFMKLK